MNASYKHHAPTALDAGQTQVIKGLRARLFVLRQLRQSNMVAAIAMESVFQLKQPSQTLEYLRPCEEDLSPRVEPDSASARKSTPEIPRK